MFLLLVAACLVHACSNDVQGILGDEELSWSASPGATRYEVCVGGEVCAWVIGATEYLVSGSPCDRINDGSGFRVRACNARGCSAWSADAVEILPHACLDARDWDPCLTRDHNGNCIGGHRTQCEYPCYDWTYEPPARRLEGKYPECP